MQLPSIVLEGDADRTGGVSFRRAMARRGRGRGGRRNILNVAEAEGKKPQMIISSTHEPGTLILSHFKAMTAEYRAEEVFLPWWPLADYVSFDD